MLLYHCPAMRCLAPFRWSCQHVCEICGIFIPDGCCAELNTLCVDHWCGLCLWHHLLEGWAENVRRSPPNWSVDHQRPCKVHCIAAWLFFVVTHCMLCSRVRKRLSSQTPGRVHKAEGCNLRWCIFISFADKKACLSTSVASV